MQAAVDTKHNIVVANAVADCGQDGSQLLRMTAAADAETGKASRYDRKGTEAAVGINHDRQQHCLVQLSVRRPALAVVHRRFPRSKFGIATDDAVRRLHPGLLFA